MIPSSNLPFVLDKNDESNVSEIHNCSSAVFAGLLEHGGQCADDEASIVHAFSSHSSTSAHSSVMLLIIDEFHDERAHIATFMVYVD